MWWRLSHFELVFCRREFALDSGNKINVRLGKAWHVFKFVLKFGESNVRKWKLGGRTEQVTLACVGTKLIIWYCLYQLRILISILVSRAARDISNPENRESQSRAARDASLERPKSMKILTETSERQANPTSTDNVQCTMSLYIRHPLARLHWWKEFRLIGEILSQLEVVRQRVSRHYTWNLSHFVAHRRVYVTYSNMARPYENLNER